MGGKNYSIYAFVEPYKICSPIYHRDIDRIKNSSQKPMRGMHRHHNQTSSSIIFKVF